MDPAIPSGGGARAWAGLNIQPAPRASSTEQRLEPRNPSDNQRVNLSSSTLHLAPPAAAAGECRPPYELWADARRTPLLRAALLPYPAAPAARPCSGCAPSHFSACPCVPVRRLVQAVPVLGPLNPQKGETTAGSPLR